MKQKRYCPCGDPLHCLSEGIYWCESCNAKFIRDQIVIVGTYVLTPSMAENIIKYRRSYVSI